MKQRALQLINEKFFRYICVGLLNTSFGYGLFSILIFINLSHEIALLIATILGVLFNFLTFGTFVFGSSNDLFALFRFVSCYIITYLFNVYLLSILIDVFSFSPYIAQFLCLAPSFLINWILFKFWVYKKY